MQEVCVVSALFNINRDKIDGRKWEEYIEWFSKTLELNVPMILFITKDVEEIVIKKRKNKKTRIILSEIKDIPYVHLTEQIQNILDSDLYRNKIMDKNRIECIYSMYSVIQYSKFEWLKEAVNLNPFNSRIFLWMDAGASRFFGNYKTKDLFPSKYFLDLIEEIGNKFIIQMNYDSYPDLYKSKTLEEKYLYDNRSFVLGSLFGGNEQAIKKISECIREILVKKMIKINNINNEQIALGYLSKQKPELFWLYKRKNKKHMDIFKMLTKKSWFQL
tara:strand:- start:4558 stop:5379 length:822 start_codon:yes stop_codon:yes gene_type:complete